MRGKKLMSALLTLFIVGTITACDSNIKNVSETNPIVKTDLSGKVTVWSWNGNLKELEAAEENFKKIHPNVTFENSDMENTQVYAKMTTALTSGSDLPDVVSVEGEYIPSFVKKFPEGFVDLTSTVKPIKDKFLSMKISECTVDGKIYAVPWDTAPTGMFYRTDIFKDAGINPEEIKTWDDYIEAGKIIAEKSGGKTKMIAIDEKGDDAIYRELLNQLGTFYFDKEGNAVINSNDSIKAMTKIRKMVDEGIVFNNDGLNSLIEAAKSSTIASMPMGVWFAGTIMKNCSDQKGKWGLFKMPAFEAGGKTASSLGGSALMVTKSSKNQKAAAEFAKFAMTDKSSLMIGFTEYGLFPSYTQCYNDAAFEQGVEFFGGQKIWSFFASEAKYIPSKNYTENFAEVKASVISSQKSILLNKENVNSTMDTLQKEISSKFHK